jgi:hypothetical protein
MREINFSFNNPGHDQHECDSVKEGDWIIFRCPLCKDYERRINAITGEMKVKNGSSAVRHLGFHFCYKPADSHAELN